MAVPHQLKINLYFDRDAKYMYYTVTDGGYEIPEKQPYIEKRYSKSKKVPFKTYTIWVEDAGKPFDLYAEEALAHYEKWKRAGNKLYKVPFRSKDGRSDWKVQKKSGVGK
jgi:hypothetical protein